ncbi:MAG TPA: sensor domain-containing diguanylate cyclase [Kofleriaceae bacterium]|nr:sensor domain-containing diguanylate cyclase [Kofleriaceae bacterium]
MALALAAAIGLCGWGFLAAATFWPGFAPAGPRQVDPLAFALFLFVIVAARAMATRILPETVVALDAAFYVAAALCIGSVPAGRLVALALTVDSVWRLAHAHGEAREDVRWADSISFVLYMGGMSGALLTLAAWWFGVDSIAVRHGAGEGTVLWAVAGTGAVFLLAHYTIQGVRLRLLGQQVGVLARRMVPALLAESALLPLAAIIVFLYDPDRPVKFILLAATYLLINYVFHRLSGMSATLRLRVAELERLNVMAHRLAGSLQHSELVDTVARETLAAIPEADVLTLTHHPDGKGPLVVDVFERGGRTQRLNDVDQDGLAARVMSAKRSLYMEDLERAAAGEGGAGDSGIRAWLGVPLEIHGDVEGALAVQSRTAHAFAPERMRLLEAIGAQAAVAFENARLYELAMVDGLTGLFVRRYFDARLDEEVQRSLRFGTDFSVVMMDIDDFKRLNDTYGHPVGDRLLKGISETVRRSMRAVDTAARYGGEEFAMILPRTPMVEAYNQAERIRQAIADFRLQSEGQVLSVTASFGISSFPESGATGAEALVRLADRALYRAKRTGKNRVELFWPDDASARPSLRPV